MREEGVDGVGAFIALTDSDEENILISLYGRSRTDGKVVTKIKRIEYDDIIEHLDLDTVVYPKHVGSDSIVRYVRSTENTLGSNMETLYHIIKGEVEASEFVIRERSAIVGTPLWMLKFKPDVLMCQNYTGVFAPLDSDARKIFTGEYLVAKKFDKFKEVLDTDPTCEKPFFGFLNGYATVPTDNLAQCAQVAFKRLQNDKGFFLGGTLFIAPGKNLIIESRNVRISVIITEISAAE
jgi:hypothetical protein